MARLIDKKMYMIKLQEVMDEAYPDTDYRKMSRYALKPKVVEQMSSYVMGKYGEYYKDTLPALIKEGRLLLEECLDDLGMTK
jgi:hypothetical protein